MFIRNFLRYCLCCLSVSFLASIDLLYPVVHAYAQEHVTMAQINSLGEIFFEVNQTILTILKLFYVQKVEANLENISLPLQSTKNLYVLVLFTNYTKRKKFARIAKTVIV